MLTAVITGGSGFTGCHMKTELNSKGIQAFDLDCDITNKPAVLQRVAELQPDWVIHLAALSSVTHIDQKALYNVNVFGTLNLLEALTQLKKMPKKVLIASTAHVYGSPSSSVIDEYCCPAPVNHYACSKLAMEHLTRNYFPQLPIIITRPFNYTGPGQLRTFLIPKIIDHFARGEKTIELGNMNLSREFSDVRDVVAIYTALLQSDHHSVTVNICNGQAIPLTHIMTLMEDIAGYSMDVRTHPDFIRKNEIASLSGSNARLNTMIPIQPIRPLKETLQDIYLGCL